MAVKRQAIPLHELSVGHVITHEGVHKIVDGYSVGYPTLDSEWSMTIVFTDSTTLVVPYPTAETTIEVVIRFY